LILEDFKEGGLYPDGAIGEQAWEILGEHRDGPRDNAMLLGVA
jgi:hypothetical protein